MWANDEVVLNGRFRIVSPLGAGGFSEAYFAEQLNLSRRVVLKTLRADLGLELSGRFGDEVRRLASVDHPSVVRVLDFGAVDGLIFIVTEEAQGVTVQNAMGSEPLLPDRALAIIKQLAEGLAAIHEKGLVHQALRADNVFLSTTAVGEVARMTDFGIARLLDPQLGDQRLTTLLKPVSHPEFSSPEQARGAPADAKSDIYALGVLGYFMLAGRLPFAGPTPADFLQQHQSATPTPLNEAAPHLQDHARIVELVMRCLEKDPALRPPTALAVAQRASAVPEVGEPTILMEAYAKLPPALPLKPKSAGVASPPAGAPVAAPTPPPRASLLPEIRPPPPTTGPFAASAPGAGAPPSASGNPVWKLALTLAVAGGLAALAFSLGLRAHSGQLRPMLEQGKAIEALTAIDAALAATKGGDDPELLGLRAAALHRLDRHKDEFDVLKDRLSPKASAAIDPLVVGGLTEDFGKKEEPALRDLLDRLPRPASVKVLASLARQKHSAPQWGALRYLDLEQLTEGVEPVARYIEALTSDSCAVRRSAARRLGQLGDWAAAEPLSRLVNTPRTSTPEKNCGQDEATEALTRLKPPGK